MDPLDFNQPTRPPGFLELLKNPAFSIHYLMIALPEAGIPRGREELELIRTVLPSRYGESRTE
jgi:hypothetical protein